jgi:predicted DNA-binding transcriptional regulator YafY
MDVVKSQALLYIYDELRKGNLLNRNNLASLFNINYRTVTRYISEINAYFANFYINCEVCYSPTDKGYKLFYNDHKNAVPQEAQVG